MWCEASFFFGVKKFKSPKLGGGRKKFLLLFSKKKKFEMGAVVFSFS
jgi:hypothetical protein